jgi:chaperonin GroEL
VIAREVGAAALGLLVTNRTHGVLDGALAVRAPGNEHTRAAIIEDIAIATGAQAYLMGTGTSLSDVTLDDLGHARQAWATADSFCILGGRGDKANVRHRIVALKSLLRETDRNDDRTRRDLRDRIGKLAGTAAVLYIGAPTEAAQAETRTRVEAAVQAAQAAIDGGAVPGGGAALLACVPAVERLAAELDGDASIGARLLTRALLAPIRAIAANAGIEASALFADASSRIAGWTFDVRRRCWVDAWSAGIIDPLAVVEAGLEASVSTAVMTMTTDVLVRRTRPPRATDP